MPFKPGDHANPNGRRGKYNKIPKHSIAAMFKLLLQKDQPKRRQIAETIIDKAAKGDLLAAKFVVSYVDGNPINTVEQSVSVQHVNVVTLPAEIPLEKPPQMEEGEIVNE